MIKLTKLITLLILAMNLFSLDVRRSEAVQIAQTATTKTPLEQHYTDPETGMEFVLVKGGCYDMGDTFDLGQNEEQPIHRVCVDDFYIGKYEVTLGQWKRMQGYAPPSFKTYGFKNCSDDCPVGGVSWKDAQAYINKLNSRTGKTYRLPTEAEWEYAARSGGKREIYAGTSSHDKLPQYAWYDYNSGGEFHPVGQKKPNSLGIYDMSGNMYEWVADWYDDTYYRNSPQNNPQGPSKGTLRVHRGGSESGDWSMMRTTYRNRHAPDFNLDTMGFRLAIAP